MRQLSRAISHLLHAQRSLCESVRSVEMFWLSFLFPPNPQALPKSQAALPLSPTAPATVTDHTTGNAKEGTSATAATAAKVSVRAVA